MLPFCPSSFRVAAHQGHNWVLNLDRAYESYSHTNNTASNNMVIASLKCISTVG